MTETDKRAIVGIGIIIFIVLLCMIGIPLFAYMMTHLFPDNPCH